MESAMRVIVLASQKGGSGKTTLAGHLAVEAERQGAGPVALIDTDPQGSLANGGIREPKSHQCSCNRHFHGLLPI